MKTNIGLVEYVEAQLGQPYWYATYGQIASKSLHKTKKAKYPGYYKATDFQSQYGKKVHDCSGLIEGYLMSESATAAPKYVKAYDYSANSLRAACEEKGEIDTIPEIPGICVFFDGHVGVYIGNGEVVEARGHAYGVVKTKLSDRPWKWWGKHPNVTYLEAETEDKPNAKLVTILIPQMQKGDKGEYVKTLQALLITKGYDLGSAGSDGIFGTKTDTAVRAYQTSIGTTADGIAGVKTLTPLFGGVTDV